MPDNEKKLKTLKDIGLFGLDSKERTGFYSKGELQKVAREWIKELEKKLKHQPMRTYTLHTATNHLEEIMGLKKQINWIKHFFNLENE